MLRRNWEAIRKLQQVPSPPGDSHKSHAQKVGRKILNSYSEDEDPKNMLGASATASLLLNMAQYDKPILTPSEIRDEAEASAEDLYDSSAIDVVIDIKSLLPSLGLIELEASYTEQWDQFETIWIAPIFPSLEEISVELDDPVALSIPAVGDVLEERFVNPDKIEDEGFVVRDLEGDELNVGVSLIRKQLGMDWIPVDGTDDLVWVNPGRVDEELRSQGDVLSYEEVLSLISDVIEGSSYVDEGLVPADIDSENIGPLMEELQTSLGWRRIGTTSDITWYSDHERFDQVYQEKVEEVKSIIDGYRDASVMELRKARAFLEFNQNHLRTRNNTSQKDLDDLIEKLSNLVHSREAFGEITAGTPGDNLESSVQASKPSEYHVAIEFEERLEELREDDGDDEHDEDSGVGNYWY